MGTINVKGQELRVVSINRSVHGYFERREADTVMIASMGRWDAPSLGIQEMPPSACVASSIIIAWLAYPELSRAAERAAAAIALYSDIAHRAINAVQCGDEDIPEWARVTALRKDKRNRKVATAEKLARIRIEDARILLTPLIMRDLSDGQQVRWTGSPSARHILNRLLQREARDEFAEIDMPNAWKRRWRPLVTVAHLAHAIAQHGLPKTEAELESLLPKAEATRKILALVKSPKIGLSQTIQFRPVG